MNPTVKTAQSTNSLDILAAGTVFRRGMWVSVGGRPGILNSFQLTKNDGPVAEVHLVDSKGVTVERITRPFDALRIAQFAEIPKPRQPTKEHGAKFGYV